MSNESYRLARMDAPILALTTIVLALPPLFFWFGLGSGVSKVGSPLYIVGAILLFVFAVVWFCFRPSRFELRSDALDVVWPSRRWEVPYTSIASVERVDRREFKKRFGWAMRVGAGGLWGGFGFLWTSRGKVRFYISRVDEYVLLMRHEDEPLLITPQDPRRFVESVRSRLSR